MVRETTYASVVSQASPKVALTARCIVVVMCAVGGGLPRPPPSPVVPAVPSAPVPEHIQVQAHIIHSVVYQRGKEPY